MCNATEDETVFGKDAWVYCQAHVRPHETGWCTVPVRSKVLLDAKNYADAKLEAKALGFDIFGE